LVEAGAQVVIVDLNEAKGAALAAELGDKTRFVAANVADEEAVKNAVATAVSTFGALHGAINCAGIGVGEKTVGKDGPHALASFKKVIEVNLIGTFNVIRLAAAQMAGQEPTATGERGVIINTASIAAFDGQIGQAAYSASKGGIVGMTLPIARDLARTGIRVVTIAPGLFDTPLLAGLSEEIRKALGAQVPFRRAWAIRVNTACWRNTSSKTNAQRGSDSAGWLHCVCRRSKEQQPRGARGHGEDYWM
jgi:NAD(P)-dependent dehydrogenase (short-subunit alcohol dehydrogenase family)